MGILERNNSVILDSIESIPMVYNISESSNYTKMEYFKTFICNQKWNVVTDPIKKCADSEERINKFNENYELI